MWGGGVIRINSKATLVQAKGSRWPDSRRLCRQRSASAERESGVLLLTRSILSKYDGTLGRMFGGKPGGDIVKKEGLKTGRLNRDANVGGHIAIKRKANDT